MNWKNSRFQIRHFILGTCHTTDEAYRKLKELYDERQAAIDNAVAQQMRSDAKLQRSKAWWRNLTKAQRLENQALEWEINHTRAVSDECYHVAMAEAAFILGLLNRLEPHRKYADLPDREAHQECQREQWLEELKFRAENFLATQGWIPHEQLAAMRQHPDFSEQILPHIKALRSNLERPIGPVGGRLAQLLGAPDEEGK